MSAPNDPPRENPAEILILGKEPISDATSILSLLLKPSAKLVGQELHDFLENQFVQLRSARRKTNLRAHLQRVQIRHENTTAHRHKIPPTLEHLKLLEDWVESVQEVDPEDKLLSSMWDNLLGDLERGANVQKILVEKLRTITRDEAEILLLFKKVRHRYSRSDSDRSFLQRMTANQLLQLELSPVGKIFILVVAATFVLSVATWLEADKEYVLAHITITEHMQHRQLPIAIMGATSILATVFWLFFGNRFSSWRLTWIGERLLAYARQHSNKMP